MRLRVAEDSAHEPEELHRLQLDVALFFGGYVGEGVAHLTEPQFVAPKFKGAVYADSRVSVGAVSGVQGLA